MLELNRSNPARSLGLALLVVAAGCAHGGSKAVPSGTAAAGTATHPTESAGNHVAAGNDLLRQGKLDEAEHEFRLALEQDPNDTGGLAGLGQVLVARGRYSEAVPQLERATRASSVMVGVFRSLGDAYVATGEVSRATMAYRQAVVISPEDAAIRISLAHSLTQLGDFPAAREASLGAIRAAKGNPAQLAQAYRQLAEAQSGDGKTADAVAAYYKAAELDPQNPEIARGLGMCAMSGGLYAEAAAAYDRVLKLAPLDVDAQKQLGWLNLKLERYPVAIQHYETVTDSLGTADRYYLAQAYAKDNKVDRAIELFRQVAAADPSTYKGVYCNMAYAYYDASKYQRAIDTAREGLNGDSASACLRFCWAQALDKLGRHEDAIPVFETVLNDPAYSESAKRELERQRRIVRLLKSKDRGNN